MEELATKKSFRQYLFFLFGQQFSLLGSSIVFFSITWWITIETQSAVFLSVSTFLNILMQVIFAPIAGVLADRISRKTIILTVDSLQAFFTFVMFLGFFSNMASIWFILAINTLRSILQAFHVPTFQAIIPAMVPKDKLSRINGANFLSSSLVFMIGPLLGAFFLELFPITVIFLIDVGTFFVALVPLILITVPSATKPAEKQIEETSFVKEFKTGFTIVKAIPGLLSMICFAMIFNLIFRPFNVLLPYYIHVTHNGEAVDLALVFMFLNMGNFLGSFITMVKKEWKHKIKINLLGEMTFFGAYSLLIFAPTGNFIFMSIGVFIAFTIFPITVSTYLTILQSVVPSDKIGRVMSIDHTISMAIAPIGALIAGPLAEILGIRTLFLICVILGIINPILLWVFTKIRYLDRQENIEKHTVFEESLEVEA